MPSRRRLWIAAYALVVAAFLAGVTRYYHPPFGLTAVIDFPAAGHEYEIPAVRNTPHFDNPLPSGYDGMYYAQLAVDPLVRDPLIDRALDDPPYRARRILFSWTAYALGLGRPAWILHAYSVQNVIAWLLLAWLLCRWMPPVGPRAFVLWSGCLLSYGMLSSVRYALPDAPSALLIACSVAAAERGRPVLASAIVGIAGLGRETNLLASTLLAKFVRRDWRAWLLVAGCLVICILPLVLWIDYLRSIYRSQAFNNPGQITVPLSGLQWKLNSIWRGFRDGPLAFPTIASALCVVAFLSQCAWMIWELVRPNGRSAWAMVGVSYAALGLVTHAVVWDGTPGAFTRVLLPLTIGTNVLLATRPRAPRAMIVAANLSVIPSIILLGWG